MSERPSERAMREADAELAVGRVRVQVDVRSFDGAIVADIVGPGRVISEPCTAVYIDGRLDRVEWQHTDRDGTEWDYVAPAPAVIRLYVRSAPF